jgi:hypothetical protein
MVNCIDQILTWCSLDSRQRKKKHTEDLEKETKVLNRERTELQSEIDALRMEMDALQMQNEELTNRVEDLMADKETMVANHTLETGELRRKITVLKEQLENVPASSSSQAPSEFTDFTNDLDGLTMDGEWGNNFGWLNDSPPEAEQQSQLKSRGVETTLVVGQGRKDAQSTPAEEGRSTFAGLPFSVPLIFGLVGAFVASAPPSTSLSQITLPDAYRAEATSIMQNVLSDRGPQPSSKPVLHSSQASNMAAAPSMPSWVQSDGTAQPPKNGFSTINPSSTLETLTAQLMKPSKQQEADAAFSMTPAQYNSLTSSDFTRREYTAASEDDDDSTPGPENQRKSLTELLRRRANRTPTNADIYTRSLLWDSIPSEVVQEFKRIVHLSGTEGSLVKEEQDS